MGPIPPAPLFASLIVGYACAYEERGAHGFLTVCIPGYSDGFGRGDLSPRPLSYEERGAHGFLTVCIPGYSDGFGRIDHAMNPKKPLAIPLAKPLTVPPFLL